MPKDVTNAYFLSLVKSALRKENVEKAPQGVDFKRIFALAHHHGLVELISYVTPEIEPKVENEIALGFERLKRAGIAKAVNQEVELDALTRAFAEEGVDYMLLKGSVIKNLYPSSDMRSMCDIDILIREKDVSKADKIMQKLGYGNKLASDHDISYQKPPYVNIELHYSITQFDFGKRAHKYYKNIWTLAKAQEGSFCAYQLAPEDFYIHHIEHMSKHYAMGGCGTRAFCDIFVFLKAHPSLNWEYIEQTLDKIALKEYESHMRALALKWFDNGQGDELSETIEDYILSGGAFGTVEREELSLIIRKGTSKKKVSKFKLVFYKIFLPYRHMKVVYPSLKKVPFLLPFYWVHRIFRTLIFRRGKIGENLKVNKKDAEIEKLNEHFSRVGLTEF